VISGNGNCREVFINGDCVSGVFNTPYKADIDVIFSTAACLNSMTNILNWRLEQKGYTPFQCGIGLAYGRALMLKAGYKGSGINDVIWMGDVVNEASNLCHQGNKGARSTQQVSIAVYDNLKDDNKKLLNPVYLSNGWKVNQYEGNIINTKMDQWLKEQKEKAAARSMFSGYSLYGQTWR